MRGTIVRQLRWEDLVYASYVWEDTEKQTKIPEDDFHKVFLYLNSFWAADYYLSKGFKARMLRANIGWSHHLAS